MDHNSPSSEEDFLLATPSSVDRHISSYRVDKAVKFLSLPEIKEISADQTKAKFLKSKGLSETEVIEAFHRFYTMDRGSRPAAPRLMLNAVSGRNEVNPRTTLVYRDRRQPNSLSLFFNLCQKLIVFVGITSSCYYVYQKWLRSRAEIDRTRKDERNIKDELNQIKNELAKIAAELRQHQAIERNQANLLTEINSLKAILVSKQYFEERQTAKLTLPSWQLNSNSLPKLDHVKSNATSSEPAADVKTSMNTNSTPPQNRVLEETDGVSGSSACTKAASPTSSSTTNGIPVTVCVLTEEDPKVTLQCNGSVNTISEKTCDSIKPEIASAVVPDKKKETKKTNGKKTNGENAEKHKKSDAKNE